MDSHWSLPRDYGVGMTKNKIRVIRVLPFLCLLTPDSLILTP